MSASEESSCDDRGWIGWYCGLEDHHFYCQVDREYIEDAFNLYGLKKDFLNYDEALEMILSDEAPSENDHDDPNFMNVYKEAIDLYGMIHSRYVLTQKGMQEMKAKFLQGVFGCCPRVLCQRQHVFPIGMSDQLRKSRVKIFCPLCEDVYSPKNKFKGVDGAYFGTSFPHVLLQTFPEINPRAKRTVFAPKICGFQVYKKKGSKYEEPVRDVQFQTYALRTKED